MLNKAHDNVPKPPASRLSPFVRNRPFSSGGVRIRLEAPLAVIHIEPLRFDEEHGLSSCTYCLSLIRTPRVVLSVFHAWVSCFAHPPSPLSILTFFCDTYLAESRMQPVPHFESGWGFLRVGPFAFVTAVWGRRCSYLCSLEINAGEGLSRLSAIDTVDTSRYRYRWACQDHNLRRKKRKIAHEFNYPNPRNQMPLFQPETLSEIEIAPRRILCHYSIIAFFYPISSAVKPPSMVATRASGGGNGSRNEVRPVVASSCFAPALGLEFSLFKKCVCGLRTCSVFCCCGSYSMFFRNNGDYDTAASSSSTSSRRAI